MSGAWSLCARVAGLLGCLAPAACSLDLPPPFDGGAGAAPACAGEGAELEWPDPLGYPKPRGIAVALPDEASCPNKWYVDLGAGSGTACTENDPCGTLADVVGKPGTTGGPAYVYVRGTGVLYLYQETFYGSEGSEIVIKPWPGAGLITLASDDDNENLFASDAIHDVVLDGGPGFDFEMVATQGAADNREGLELQGCARVTIRRCRFRGGSSISSLAAVGAYGTVDAARFVNCDFSDAATASAGLSIGNVDSTAIDPRVEGCVFRGIGASAILVRTRVLTDGLVVDGSAFHDVGKLGCPACGQGVRIAPEEGDVGSVTVQNNLFWDLGSGAVHAGAGSSRVVHNTVFDFAKGSGDSDPEAISGGSAASVESNILYSPDGAAPLAAGGAVSARHNLCGTGCDVAWAAGTFLSEDPGSPDFLELAAGSPAVDAGDDVGIDVDYAGNCRPLGARFDLGAFEAR